MIPWHLWLLICLIASLWIWESYGERGIVNTRGVFALLGTMFLTLLYGGVYWW